MAVNYISATLNADKSLVVFQTTPINSGENLSTEIKISIPTQLIDYNFSLEFLLPNDKKYSTGYLPLEIFTTQTEPITQQYFLTYSPDRSLLSKRGRVYLQVCGRKAEDTDTVEVFKSVKCADASFEVNPSIFDANEPFVNRDELTQMCEAISKAQALLDEVKANIGDGIVAGKDGVTPDISITATTLEAGSQATVTKSGTKENPIFDFGIPKGDKGAKGDKGEKGVSIISIQKTDSVSLEDTYTITFSDNSTTTFTIINGANGADGEVGAKGDKGEDGSDGINGTNGLDGITYTPVVDEDGFLGWVRSDGSEEVPDPTPIIPIIGDDGNWWLGETSLGLPSRGEQGEQGEQGAQGASGATFTPSVDATGNLSWSNNGGLTNPATVNIKGAQGITGYGFVHINPETTLEYSDYEIEQLVDTNLVIQSNVNDLRIGDTLVCPYYNTDSFTMRIFAGKITYFDVFTNKVTIKVLWYFN